MAPQLASEAQCCPKPAHGRVTIALLRHAPSCCAPTVQTRTCEDGTFDPDFPACDHLTCDVLPPADCGDVAHGDSETRDCFGAESVPFGEECVASAQTRTCNDGTFDPDFGPCAQLTCEVLPPADCGDLRHGHTERRDCYAASTVPFGEECVLTIQTRTCEDGTFDPDFLVCDHLGCEVLPGADCGDIAHGVEETRERYLLTRAAAGDVCPLEVQTRTCLDGSFTEWSGSFEETSCAPCGDGIIDDTEICDEGEALDCGSCAADCRGDGTGVDCEFSALTAGSDYACALTPTGSVECWGSAIETPPSGTFDAVAAGDGFGCAIAASDGTLECWGTDSDGQASPPDGEYTSLCAGWDHACALDSRGTPTCWGNDFFDATSPPRFLRYASITCGAYHSCGLSTVGTVTCWGSNNFGQRSRPTGSFRSIDAGGIHNCGILADGTASCWGSDLHDRSSPPAGEQFRRVSAGGWHSCGITTAGEAVCWGRDSEGESSAPAGAFLDARAGDEHSCALGLDGTLTCWGLDVSGSTSPP